jgi:hypothetical protein
MPLYSTVAAMQQSVGVVHAQRATKHCGQMCEVPYAGWGSVRGGGAVDSRVWCDSTGSGMCDDAARCSCPLVLVVLTDWSSGQA